jgi:hypothetical protein
MKHVALPYSFIAAMAAFAPIVEREHDAALTVNEDNPRLTAINALADALATCMVEAPAASLRDLSDKGVILKIRLPAGRPAGTLWDGADLQEQLAWGIAEDALRLARGSSANDPAVAAAEAYFTAVMAVNTHPGNLGDAEFDRLFQASEAAALAAYRIRPTTRAGAHAFLDMLLDHEAGCTADREVDIALETLRNCLGAL